MKLTVEELFSDLPFLIKQEDFHEYYDKVVSGEILPESFICLSGNYSTHEIGHLIECRDEDILDPFWGIPFTQSPRLPTSGEFAFRELEVIVIQATLDYFIDCYRLYGGVDWSKDFDLSEFCQVYAHGSVDISRKEMEEKILEYLKKWTLEKILNELSRKKLLVRKLLK